MQTVHQILKNGDFTEGRGPMVPMEIAFEEDYEAYAYIGKHLIDPYGLSKNINNEVAKGKNMCKEGWYSVKQVHVFASEPEAASKQEALKVKKLLERFKPEEIELLRRNLSEI